MLSAHPAAAQLAVANEPSSLGLGTGTVSGTVTMATGQPARDCRIELHDLSNGRPAAATYTLPNGSFELDRVPVGHYELVASSGLNEAREQIDVEGVSAPLTVRLAGDVSSNALEHSTVSVAQLKIPGKARHRLEKAQHLADKNKLDQARTEVDKALKIAPQYAAALTLRGILAMQQGNAAEALTDLQAAVRNDPNYAMGQIVLGSAYNMLGRFDDAIRQLSRAETIAPAAWQLHFELGKALLGKGDFEQSLRQAAKAAELNDWDYAPVHLVIAHAYLGLKNYEQAVAQLEQYLARAPHGAGSASARQTLDQVKAFVASK